MIDLAKVKVCDLLPVSLQSDNQVLAAAQALDGELQEVSQQAQLIILLARLDLLPEKQVDELAWQYHLDFYDHKLPLKTKRDLVRQSLAWHRIKGTPQAVEQIVTALLGDSAEVLENWEYGGKPYCFKVRCSEGNVPDEKALENIYKAIKAAKNTRSWLDGLDFVRSISQKIYYAAIPVIKKTVSIYPQKPAVPEIGGRLNVIGFVSKHKEVTICQIGAD